MKYPNATPSAKQKRANGQRIKDRMATEIDKIRAERTKRRQV